MKLILISYPTNIDNEHKIITHLFEQGLEYFHLRKTDFSFQDFKQYLRNIPDKYYPRIIIHSHFNLLNDYNLKGVHFNKNNIHLVREYQSMRIHKSISAHSFDELLKLDKTYDYAFLSPVFNSISKPDYKSKFNFEEITQFFNPLTLSSYAKAPLDRTLRRTRRKTISTDIIALGGIDIDKIEPAYKMGFSGVAVLGYIWNNYIIDRNIKTVIETFKKLKEKCQKFALMY